MLLGARERWLCASRSVGVVEILFVCSANRCRSPMAAALFAVRAAEYGVRPVVRSAGVAVDHLGVPDEVLEVMVAYGIDLSRHRSAPLERMDVARADVVIGMTGRHVQEIALLDPPSWHRTFRLKEFARRGRAIGPRLPGQDVPSWVRAVHHDRPRADLVDLTPTEDIGDPMGGPLDGFAATARAIDELAKEVTGLLWSSRATRTPAEW